MYKSILNVKETQIAIKDIRDFFQEKFSEKMNLLRVSAPLFLDPLTGLNDDLSGEKAVAFSPKFQFNKKIEIIHSLAKWKRYALKKYNLDKYEGVYANMNAIRQEEIVDNTHSLYVDQWDWEKVIDKKDRNAKYLFEIVNEIYQVIKKVDRFVAKKYAGKIFEKLPKDIFIIDSQDLENMYPKLTAEQREDVITRDKGAVFVWKVGYPLDLTKRPHSLRAADYDDWELNGDLLVYDSVMDRALELSSMGIRVDKIALSKQKDISLEELGKINPFYEGIIKETLPFSIGGGIGQSRLCMFFLEKKHIGEVQVSVWPEEYKESLKSEGIFLL